MLAAADFATQNDNCDERFRDFVVTQGRTVTLPSFDPYFKWLGIPPQDQPPHHYRLLGIELYESNREVINAAANRVIGYLLQRVDNRESPLSKKLIGEIADARACLLDRRSKAQYDQQLGERTRIQPPKMNMTTASSTCPRCGAPMAPRQTTCSRCKHDRRVDKDQFEDTKIGQASKPASAASTRSAPEPVVSPRPPAHDSSPVVPIADATPLPQAKPPVTVARQPAKVQPNLTIWLLAACGAISVIIVGLLVAIVWVHARRSHLAAADRRDSTDRVDTRPVRQDPRPANTPPQPSPPPIPLNPICGTITDSRLPEISGIARSIRNPDLLWVHNDSGHTPQLFLIDQRAETRAAVRLTELDRMRDWEDITTFEHDGTSYAMVADIGDNSFNRPNCMLYVIEEPHVSQSGPPVTSARLKKSIQFTYEDGKHNCEAIAVDPADKTILLATKDERGGPSIVYMLPPAFENADTEVRARAIARLILPTPVYGMDISADGRRAVLLGKDVAFEFSHTPGQSWQQTFSAPYTTIQLPHQEKGEAVAYSLAGDAVFLTSEELNQPLYRWPISTARPH
jgi:hypothetical protein